MTDMKLQDMENGNAGHEIALMKMLVWQIGPLLSD